MTRRASGEYRNEGITRPTVEDAVAPGEASHERPLLPRARKGSA
jgi:hypothetical protein